MIWYLVVVYMSWTSHNTPPHPAFYKLGPYTYDQCEAVAKAEYEDIMKIGKMQLLEKPYCDMVPVPE